VEAAYISNVVTPLGDAPNSPRLDVAMKEHVPALRDIGQALQLVRSLQVENRTRGIKNSRILERYNSERPWDPGKLKADGLSWKANFTTKPLTTLIDRVVPRFTSATRNMKYLTASQLPPRFDNAVNKTEEFRREITDTCRAHEQWDELITDLAQENTLFGYVSAGWLDSYSWFPRFYNQEAFLVPQGTKHSAKSAPVICFRDTYLLHELFDMVRDDEAAKLAGWDVANVVEAMNNAVPTDLRSVQNNYARIYQDLIRSSAVLSSFTGAKSVIVWHVFVSEVDGRVTHVAFDDHSGKQLYWNAKQFERMSDIAAFFSFQHGNGMLQGSKGIGRELYNMASILDRARNEVVDRLQLSGKLVLQCEEKEIKRFRMSIIGNAILIASGYSVTQAKIDGDVEPFFQLDEFLTKLLDSIAGNTSPKIPEGDRVTADAVNLAAAREEETKDAVISRFLLCFARFMTTIQRRLCDASTVDTQAKEMQARLLKVMSREELDYLSKQPAVATVLDFSDAERQQIALIAQEGRGNPLYNQYELEKQSLTAKIGSDFANSVLLPQNDPTEQAENQRQQQLEILLIQLGQEVPVSPRDNHIVHLDVLHSASDALIAAAQNNPHAWDTLRQIAKHGIAHVNMAEKAGLNEKVAPYRAFLAKLVSTLQKLHQSPGAPGVPVPENPDSTAPVSAADTGMPGADGMAPAAPQIPFTPIHEAINIAYKDFPEDVKRQIEQKLGLTPSTMTPATSTTAPASPEPSSVPAPVAPGAPPG
jgi:hypothetical protein